MYAPYYGAYFASAALGGAESIAQLDNGAGELAMYAMYKCGADSARSKIAILNTAIHTNTTSGPRPATTVTLSGLKKRSKISLKRLTAPYATSQQELGQEPTWAGQSFSNKTCALQGTQKFEKVHVGSDGHASITVAATEAVLLFL